VSAAVLARDLKRRAGEAGFDAVGVAAADRLDRDGAALAAWLRAGMAASMAWMAREPGTRADPRRLLPGCRSVVVLAMNYWPGEARARAISGRGRVALYARGRDYHKVMGRKLGDLSRWLERRSGLPARSFVDTGPVLERAWAQRAGVGWIGKNANLLARDRGSWLLLGEILTAAELEPDPGPHADHCGSCTACIEACPTGAIVGDGVVDSNRCIAYWTIEHRGPIPEPRREALADWIFGCDLCQEVCPWNLRFAQPAPLDRFGVRDDLQGVDPEAVLGMSEREFRDRYSGTSLMRAKWEGMRRNACLVLGNRREASSLPALSRALQDPDEVVRSHAAWAIGRIRGFRGQGR
jgi:epoxyqueuosine reductase